MTLRSTRLAGTAYVLDHIPFHVEVSDLVPQGQVAAADEDAADLVRLIKEARHIGHPQALYRVSFVGDRGDDWVDLEGVRFTSRVLRVNLEATYRVFPYIVTCGRGLHDWAGSQQDLLGQYWAQSISALALRQALHALMSHLEQFYSLGPTARMSPGSLVDWPLEQQRAMFELFGGEEQQIGVRLSEHLLMQPTKSVSGICYPTDLAFESCQLCPREICDGRRAAFEPGLWAARYARTRTG